MKSATTIFILMLCGLMAACMPTTSSTIAIASPPMPTGATEFVRKAAASNSFEIETSRLALASATRPDVRAFANRMVRDHTNATARLASAASASGVPVPPPSLDPAQTARIETLKKTPAGSFDAAYLSAQAQAHQEAINLFSSFGANGTEPALVAFARRTLPTLRMHAAIAARLGASAARARV